MSGTYTAQDVFDRSIQCALGQNDPLEFLAELVELAHTDRAAVDGAQARLRSVALAAATQREGMRALGLVDEALRLARQPYVRGTRSYWKNELA
ncbi:MAG: hypothetical protein JWP02_1611 [Acidimicrobiales bacterium]|nr:hypothetical protein [Acidimicrobiales bacterium]